MRPILVKGHERPITFLKYNFDGDLLFSCAKDHNPTVWFADNGERLGNYKGHNGAVWSCSISRDSLRLLTASADQTVKLWSVQKGQQLFTFNFDAPARSVDFSVDDKLAVITTDPFMKKTSAIHVKKIAEDIADQTDDSLLVIRWATGRINRAVWGPLNKFIIGGDENGIICMWDPVTGQEMLSTKDNENGHKDLVSSLCLSADGSHFLTGSLDKTAKLWDTRTLTLIKTYATKRPVNAVSMSPILDHVVLGGGQDARNVAIKLPNEKFEAKFYEKILEQEIGGVKGHFGPLNALAFNPDGKSFVSGGEDGYVRLHHLDPSYFHIKI